MKLYLGLRLKGHSHIPCFTLRKQIIFFFTILFYQRFFVRVSISNNITKSGGKFHSGESITTKTERIVRLLLKNDVDQTLKNDAIAKILSTDTWKTDSKPLSPVILLTPHSKTLYLPRDVREISHQTPHARTQPWVLA